MKHILSEVPKRERNGENLSHRSKASVVNSSRFCPESPKYIQKPLGLSQSASVTLPDSGVMGCRPGQCQSGPQILGRRLKNGIISPLCG